MSTDDLLGRVLSVSPRLRPARLRGGARGVRVVHSETHPPGRDVRWVVAPFVDAADDLYDELVEVRLLGTLGRWEAGLVGDVPGSPVRVEVVHRGGSTVFVGWANRARARLHDPSTGLPLSLARRPRPVDDRDLVPRTVRIAIVDDPDGGVPNADVARLERLLDDLPREVSERLLADGRLLRSRAAALALLDAVESGAPIEWALRRAEAALA